MLIMDCSSDVCSSDLTAFVSPLAVPQLADAPDILTFAQSLPGLDVQILVPNLRNAERALAAGARHLSFVLSVSKKHNLNNVRRTPEGSVEEYARIVEVMPQGISMRLNVATAFDCPFDGPVAAHTTLALIDKLVSIFPGAEVCPCDTTGRVTPDRVHGMLSSIRDRFPALRNIAYHGHDTYGLGVANALAAIEGGATAIDASFAGLGGCPFAPGATGNVATEDVVWTLDRMGLSTGIALDLLLEASGTGAALPGGLPGGRVRQAIAARACLNKGLVQ